MIVLDSNAAINIVKNTDEGKALQALILDNEEVIAPDLFVYEVSNIVRNYIQFKNTDIKTAMDFGRNACGLVDGFVNCEDMWDEVTAEAVHNQHSSYDIFYFVLARRNNATLFTLDKKLQEICVKNKVNCVYLDEEF
ncbi:MULTISPECIES: type II toxin-antitoxin system VapC family toxin [unclassified Adlercreutzia]|uniref:type II toxin-antitoxin system VapC family toxin n=1 Tax=unclassified Adlercreutzia TaxID=2636013 RepID=UPI0013EBFCEE|nr:MULTISPECIES: type II toxin-antitoxin system VapC family toxin [unclassified Adlercreutzia]